MRHRLALAAVALTLASCEQARRYPPAEPSRALPPEVKKNATELPVHWSWLRTGPTEPDTPIVFVPDTAPGWSDLPRFWNQFPPPAAGKRTVHFGLPPLQAVAALLAADRLEMVHIRVPRALPDPNPLIPAANPPTVGKWQLGKKLFFDPVLKSGSQEYACAACHRPA